MTIREAIDRLDALVPNAFTKHDKTVWLATLDGRIYEELVKTHAGAGEWHDYVDDTDGTTQLLVPFPFDDIYITWLSMQVSLFNSEITRYNNEAVRFNAQFEAFANFYNRTHMPLGKRFCYFGKDDGAAGGGRVKSREGEKIADPLS